MPLRAGNPAARHAWVLADCGARLLLTDDTLAGAAIAARDAASATAVCPDAPVRVVTLAELDSAGVPEAEPGPVLPGQLGYLMYTSGSTGLPKGVAIAQQDVTELAVDRCFQGGTHRRVLLHSPYAFDASVYEMWVPLLTGGCVVVAPPGELSPDALADMVAGHGVTALLLTSGLFQVVADELPGALAGLRQAWTGGDTASPGAVARVRAACPETTVVNGYGPTEVTVLATSHAIEPSGGPDRGERDVGPASPGATSPGPASPGPASPVPVSPVPVGRPLDNMRAYVLDGWLQPVPAEVAGEGYTWRAAGWRGGTWGGWG